MQESGSQQDLNASENNNVANKSQNNSEDVLRVELNSYQLTYLTRFLPKQYSFQVETKLTKRASISKNPKEELLKTKSNKSIKDNEGGYLHAELSSQSIQKTNSIRAAKNNSQKYSE